jgi:hypothetical protein
MKSTFTLVALVMAGEAMPVVGWTQVLTTGGTAGSSINDGANIGAGNHTGASVNFSNPEADQIRTRLGGSGQAVAKQNTIGQLRQAGTVSTNNVTTTPAMTGATGSVHGNTAGAVRATREVRGAATVADILPRGSASYTYYPEAQVYFSSTTKTYYYSRKGRWYSSTSLPTGVKLTNGRSVQLNGNGAASVMTP